jgi:hypothetical protein
MSTSERELSNSCPFHNKMPSVAPPVRDAVARRYVPSEFDELKRDMETLAPAIAWVDGFVKQANPDLGRLGVVCPFVPEAIRQNLLQYFVLDVTLPPELWATSSEYDYAAVIEPAILKLSRQFVEGRIKDPRVRLLHAYLIVFRGLHLELGRASALIETIQRKLKPRFVELGLMIGEFHPHSNAGGLRNPDFRPLRSPVPLLAFRNMVEIDFVFLSRKNDPAPLRVRFLKSYLFHLGTELGSAARSRAETALQEAEQEILPSANIESSYM